ncbi:MAG TPA: MBL fold metallo-hydrolase [Steroidobacteraceae bacterium]|nr:MBL fold metallo-hydrolase [Steroidobacteraceae bacterium]
MHAPGTKNLTRLLAALLLSMAAFTSAQGQAPVQTPAVATAKPEYRVQPLRTGLYLLQGGGGNVVLWAAPDGVLLIDDGTAAAAPQLIEAIGRITHAPVRFVVNTHWHPDHTGGNEALARSGAVILAHESVRERLAIPQPVEETESRSPVAPAVALPLVTFATSAALHLAGDRVDLVHVADAHSDGDVVARWATANVVAVGDLYWNAGYPFIELASGGSLPGVVAALEAILARADGQTLVIPGHGAIATRAELAAYRDMLVAVGKRVRAAVEQGQSVEEVLAAHPTAEFDERYGRGGATPERFVRTLYREFAGGRSAR